MSGSWSTVTINGKPADVFDPPGGPPRFGVLYLHGAGLETLNSPHAAPYTPLLADLRLACVCPHTHLSWWSDRVCPEFDPVQSAERHVLDDVLPYFGQRWGLGARAVGLFGISMGGQGALRLGFKYPDRFPVVAALASAIEYHEVYDRGYSLDVMYDSKEQARQDTAPMHVHPSRQPPHLFFAIDPEDADWLRGNERLDEKLNALGVAHTVDFTTRAGGHSWAYFNHMAGRVLEFLKTGLEHEARRLL